MAGTLNVILDMTLYGHWRNDMVKDILDAISKLKIGMRTLVAIVLIVLLGFVIYHTYYVKPMMENTKKGIHEKLDIILRFVDDD